MVDPSLPTARAVRDQKLPGNFGKPRSLRFELAIVVIVSLAVLAPGIWSYSLVDPWETHYGEVGRMMLQDHDWVHMDWPQDGEGFRSKPVLTFWLMASGMRAMGLAADGGYSGELEHDARTMIAIRLPFVLFAVLGLVLMWWMLARLVNRRLAWLALLVVGSTPFFCLVARQGIPDMPLCACVMGAIAMFAMAMEDGERPLEPLARVGPFELDARHALFLVVGGFVVVQAIYYVVYFTASPQLAVARVAMKPALMFALWMGLSLVALSRDGWLAVRTLLLFVPIGGVIALARGNAIGHGPPGRSLYAIIRDDYLAHWERHALDRYVVRALAFLPVWALGGSWRDTDRAANRVLGMAPIATTRQVYLLWCYALLGVSILAKGPPGIGVVGLVGVFYVILHAKWRALYDGRFELKRGLILMIVVALPWHVAMFLKDGARFIDEYVMTHIMNRGLVGVDNSPGTFEHYTQQLGNGMWLWAALLPAAVAATIARARTDTREGRVRFLVALWAIVAVFFFSIVQTKFHHYILPAVPALGILVAFFLDDILAGRDRLHPLYAALGIGIVVLVARDLIWDPARWIHMFVFRYDRPWPTAEPWAVDPSDGFIGLAIIACAAIAVAALPWRRVGVAALGAAALAICLWSLHVYMPLAGTHWGMREAVHGYYANRTIYGEKLVYFGGGELAAEWADVGNTWTFDTFVPDTLHVGQPMTITVQLNKPDNERVSVETIALVGSVTQIGDHSVEVTFAPGERAKIDVRKYGAERGRPPLHVVDADRLIAWQLYWRGENFWSGDEIWGWLPENKTAFVKTDSVEFGKYMQDRTKAPLGRRYFMVTEAGRALSVRSMLPTPRARDSFEVLDTTSNKFTMVAFWL